MSKIFNLSLPKTATTSFGMMMKKNNKRVCDGRWKDNKTNYLVGLASNNDIHQIIKFTNLYDIFCDIPWGGYKIYKQISRRVEPSKFILISRPTDEWYKSLTGEIDKLIINNSKENSDMCSIMNIAHKIEAIYSIGCYGFAKMLNDLADQKELNEASLKLGKERYEKKVRRFFKGKQNFLYKEMDEFLILDKETVDFLEIKKAEMPHANKRK